jgi:hypothetical protein
MSEKLCTVPLRRELLSGRNAGSKNSTPEDSRLCSMPSAARFLAPMRRVAVSIIFRPTESVCAIRSSTPKACVLPPALSRPDARLPLARVSNAPACIGPFQAPMPSSLYAAQNLVVVFKTSGSADQNAGLHDPSLSWGAPVSWRASKSALKSIYPAASRDGRGCSLRAASVEIERVSCADRIDPMLRRAPHRSP